MMYLKQLKQKKPMSLKEKVVPSTKLSKQHSILFSVIPSRDAKTGKKIVTSDDEDETAEAKSTTTTTTTTEASVSSRSRKKKTAKREVCQYGEKCYRTNSDHLEQYEHPPSKGKAKSTKTKTPCTFGAKCTRQSSVHLANYSHPSKSKSQKPVDIAAQEELVDPKELIESDEPGSPTTTDNLLVKDKNKGRKLDDVDDDDDGDDDNNDEQESNTRTKANKRKGNLEEKSKVKPTRKRIKKS